MTSHPGPVAAAERVVQLDVLRGLAILGILLVNAPSFAMPFAVPAVPDASPLPFEAADFGVWWTMRTFFEQKFITLFSLLFGVSVFLVGGEWGDGARTPVLRRRLIWLAVIGLLHGALVWYGDILLHYALVGAIMSQFRSWAPRRLLKVGVILFAVSALLPVGSGFLIAVAPPEAIGPALEAYSPAAVRRAIEQFGGPDLLGVQAANFSAWLLLQVSSLVAFGPRTLAVMMIGLALFKSGLLQGRGSSRIYGVLLALGVASLALIGWAAWGYYRAGFPPEQAQGPAGAVNFFLSPLVTLGYVAAVSLLLRSGAGRVVGGVLAPAGRMAFTNYLTQSLLMTAVFYGGGRGLGLFGEWDWPQWSALVLAVWAVQLVWSRLWLSRFSMGPAEWVWRRLSYGGDAPRFRVAPSPR